MTTVRIHSGKSNGTNTFLRKPVDSPGSGASSGEWFIEIDARKITQSLKKSGSIEIAIPVTEADWGDKRSLRDTAPWSFKPYDFVTEIQNAPERLYIDLDRLANIFTVEGYITRLSAKDPGSDWDTEWANLGTLYEDVFQVRDLLTDMFEFGGPVTFEYGIPRDGIENSIPYRWKVIIETLQFTEEPQGPGQASRIAEEGKACVPQTLRVAMTVKVMTER